MLKYAHRLFYTLVDAALFAVSIYLALLIRFEGAISEKYLGVYYKSVFPIVAGNILILILFGVYRSMWRYASAREIPKLIASIFCCTAAMYAYRFVLEIVYPRSFYVIFLFLSAPLIGGSRLLPKLGSSRLRLRGQNAVYKSNVMIVGAGIAGAMLIKELRRHPELRLLPTVLIDDDKRKRRMAIDGVPVVGDRYDIQSAVEKYSISEIIIAIPSASKNNYADILRLCRGTRCKLRTLPGVYEIIDGRVTVNHIRDVGIEDLLSREEIKLDIEKIAGYLRDDVVLVTGGGGSIGSELCRQIMRFDPRKLIIFDIYENNAYELQNELFHTYGRDIGLEVLIGSVRDRDRLNQIFSRYKPGVVFHAAAHKHVPLMESNPAEAVKNNVLGTLNVAECADEFHVKKFVLISTDKAVNPTNVMGATKRLAEMIVESIDKISETEFSAVRFGNVLGSNGSVIPLFKKQIAQGGPVTVTHPDIIRYFMTIPEAAQLVIQAGAMARGGEIFVLDMGEPVKIVDLANDLIRLSGLSPGKDIKLEFTGLRPGEKLYEELLTDEEGITQTSCDKIFVVKPLEISYSAVMLHVRLLEKYLSDPEALRKYLVSAVPTYRCEYGNTAQTEIRAFDHLNVR